MKPSLSKCAALSFSLFFTACLFVFTLNGCENDRPVLILGGGHSGSTFQGFATELGRLLNQEIDELQIKVKETAGSLDNLIRVERGKMDMALVNAEDAYLGKAGLLPSNDPATENVQALIRLYGTAVQLVVLENSPYRNLYDLKKHRVAIGGSRNTGSALVAERFFRSVNIWQDIIPIYVNSSMGLKELVDGSVDAVWILGDIPNDSIQKTNQKFPIRLLELWNVALDSHFFRDYPFYSFSHIYAGTYKGQENDIFTFQSPTLWVANRNLDADLVYRALKILFSEKGLAHMRLRVPIARELDAKKGLEGGKITFHPGAVRFLREAI